MNIGFDLDRIFVNYPPFMPGRLIDKLYKEKDNGILKYRIPGSIEQKIRQLSHTPIFRPTIKKHLEFLEEVSKSQKHNLYLISSRFGFLRKQTEKLTQKHGFENLFHKLFFNYNNEQPHEFKSRIVKAVKLNRYIDDDLSLIKYLAKENPNIIFYWLNNSVQRKLADNIFAVTDIAAVLK